MIDDAPLLTTSTTLADLRRAIATLRHENRRIVTELLANRRRTTALEHQIRHLNGHPPIPIRIRSEDPISPYLTEPQPRTLHPNRDTTCATCGNTFQQNPRGRRRTHCRTCRPPRT
jgi:hypothetical protein